MSARPQRLRSRFRDVTDDAPSYDQAAVRRRVELLTIRESSYVPRLPRDGDDDRPRMVDTGAYLRMRRRR